MASVLKKRASSDPLLPAPPGLQYVPDVLSPSEEQALVEIFREITFSEVRMHGVAAKRRVRHYGWVYGYETWRLQPGPPIPDFLLAMRKRVADLAGLKDDLFQQALLTEYSAGAGIGWHRDAPMFGPVVIGVSLLSSCRLRLRRQSGSATAEVTLEPRSAYLLSGVARSHWQHSIPPTKSLRYSVTFRTLLQPAAPQ